MNWKLLVDFSQDYGKPVWGENKEIAEWIPGDFVSLYLEYDPLDVELPYEGNSLIMVPYQKLESYLNDYELDKKSLVFATCNGDPLFINDSKIYTFAHGIEKPTWELLNESAEQFFLAIINE